MLSGNTTASPRRQREVPATRRLIGTVPAGGDENDQDQGCETSGVGSHSPVAFGVGGQLRRLQEERKHGGVCQDCRGLNALQKSDSGGLGDVVGMSTALIGAGCCTSIDLASISTQLEIAEKGRHKVASRDAYGELWVSNRCGLVEGPPFGLCGLCWRGATSVER